MRRCILLLIATVVVSSSMAQNIVVVDSEKIFKSIVEYNEALSQIDLMSEKYQKLVDDKFAAVEKTFNDYAVSKATYTPAQRKSVEATILKMENDATKFQEDCFSKDGLIMKTRLSLISPIQKRVFEAIDAYAEAQGADLVLDEASNPSVLFVGRGVNHTDGVIKMLRQTK